MARNIGNYIDDIDYKVEVFKNVYWVPLNALGKTRYDNETVLNFISLTPGEKRNKISNLYEAVQLFQLTEFKGVYDNKEYNVNNDIWQTHKNAMEAVAANEGCCATDTNWLSYFIADKYDEVGSFCYANEDCNGHITTYIKQNEWFYFIDMMMCRKDSQLFGCIEDGNKASLFSKEWAGSLFMSREPKDFCMFNLDRFKQKGRNEPFGFYIRRCKEVTATGLRFINQNPCFLIPTCDNPSIVYIKADAKADIAFAELPCFASQE